VFPEAPCLRFLRQYTNELLLAHKTDNQDSEEPIDQYAKQPTMETQDKRMAVLINLDFCSQVTRTKTIQCRETSRGIQYYFLHNSSHQSE
jgi:hypothetical protein